MLTAEKKFIKFLKQKETSLWRDFPRKISISTNSNEILRMSINFS